MLQEGETRILPFVAKLTCAGAYTGPWEQPCDISQRRSRIAILQSPGACGRHKILSLSMCTAMLCRHTDV